MLTKSLHTITAATNVATVMIRREKVLTAATAQLCASDALYWLGYEFNPASSEWRDDPTLTRILANCEKALQTENKRRRTEGNAATYGDRVALLQRQAG